MIRKNVIVYLDSSNIPIVRGNFKKLCLELNLPYHSLKVLKFPIVKDNYKIYKCEFL